MKFAVGWLLTLAVSSLPAWADADGSAENPYLIGSEGEVDITDAVRIAGKGTTELEEGRCLDGYTVDNAFGIGETKESRVMLVDKSNILTWTIADDFAAGLPIFVTKYTIKRTSPASGTTGTYGQQRAPTVFSFQGSYNGSDWIPLSKISTTWDENTLEKTFEIDPLCYDDYRKYRFVTTSTAASSGDTAKCSFQYIKVYGTIGDWPPGAAPAKLEYMCSRWTAASVIPTYTPTLDSRIELDVSLSSVSGTQAILGAGYSTGGYMMRLFHMETDGWVYFYGNEKYSSGKKATKDARYHIVIDGPVVTVNGQEVINAGATRLNVGAGTSLWVAGSPADRLSKLNNIGEVNYWSVKAYDRHGNLALDLKPTLDRGGGCVWQDSLTKRLFGGSQVDKTERLAMDYRINNDIVDVTATVREAGAATTVTLVEGLAHDSYPDSASNLFVSVQDSAHRALFKTKRAVVQYDIPDSYHTGSPIVLTHYAVIPVGFGTGTWDEGSAKERTPSEIELWASIDGGKDWDGWVKIHEFHSGMGPAFFCKGAIRDLAKNAAGNVTFRGHLGSTFKIPEENRGDYRHYRFVMVGTTASSTDSAQLALQELRIFGHDGAIDPCFQPVAYLQNEDDQSNSGKTRIKTGVKPSSVEGFTIEIKGAFTTTAASGCLFCARDADGANTWTLFLLNGQLRLDCETTGSPSGFRPTAGKEYTFKVTGNKLYVYDADGTQVHASTAPVSTDFTPGSQIVLMASHKADSAWDNQARFKMTSCKMTDRFGAVVFDGIPCLRTSDNKASLFNRVTRMYMGGTNGRYGKAVDCDFAQRGRTVSLVSDLDERGRLPKTLDFTFTDNQVIVAELYAAFDNKRKDTDFDAWAKKVKLGDLKTGVDGLTDIPFENPECYRYVKFFVRDPLEGACSQTRTYKAFDPGLQIIVR